MADRYLTIPVEGETRLGSSREGLQGTVYVASPAGPGLGTVIAADGVAANGTRTTWYLFVTSAGVLRISSTYPTNTESDGAPV